MNIFIAVFSYGFPKLQVLRLKYLRAKDISFARGLIGHVARLNQMPKVDVLAFTISESDLDAWHTLDVIFFSLKYQFQSDIHISYNSDYRNWLYFPLMSSL